MGTGSIFSSSETKVKNGTCPHFSARHLFVHKPAFVVDWLVIYLIELARYQGGDFPTRRGQVYLIKYSIHETCPHRTSSLSVWGHFSMIKNMFGSKSVPFSKRDDIISYTIKQNLTLRVRDLKTKINLFSPSKGGED